MLPQTVLAQSAQGTVMHEGCNITDVSTAIKINMTLPGITQKVCDKDTVEPCLPSQEKIVVKNLPCFIIGIYTYFAGVAGILATVMIMYGGLKYVTSFGNQQRITEAKDTVFSAMTGLVLTLVSYVLLYWINPNLTSFKLEIEPIPPIEQSNIYKWEELIFCKGKADMANSDQTYVCQNNLIGRECVPVGLPDGSTNICIAIKVEVEEGGETVLKPRVYRREEQAMIFDSKPEANGNYRGNEDYNCGDIVYKEGSFPFGGALSDIGTKCGSDEQGCLIFRDDGFEVYQTPKGSNGEIIGAFVKYSCI